MHTREAQLNLAGPFVRSDGHGGEADADGFVQRLWINVWGIKFHNNRYVFLLAASHRVAVLAAFAPHLLLSVLFYDASIPAVQESSSSPTLCLTTFLPEEECYTTPSPINCLKSIDLSSHQHVVLSRYYHLVVPTAGLTPHNRHLIKRPPSRRS